jgi:multicomponent Na+:H+ antiporter subunit E
MIRITLPSLLVRAALLATLWLFLTDARADGLVLGALTVAGAVLLSARIAAPGPGLRLRLGGFLRFLAFFFWDSLKGALDIAWRCLAPRLPLHPAVVEHTSQLAGESPRVLYADVVSLLPGSLVMGMDGARIRVHLIDDAPAFREQLQVEEQRLADALEPREP